MISFFTTFVCAQFIRDNIIRKDETYASSIALIAFTLAKSLASFVPAIDATELLTVFDIMCHQLAPIDCRVAKKRTDTSN